MRFILFICLYLCTSGIFYAQNEDPILFTVGNQEVRVSEFDYIYNKNNGDNANYSEESLQEYLDLYIKFKLKVQRAKDMKLDTIVVLQKELAGYRKQLAKSYLNDREVVEGLIREVFERKKKDIRVSHILIPAKERESKEVKKAAYDKALSIKKALEGGANFRDVAKDESGDPNSNRNGGDIGFVTAKLPNGFYEFENTVYTLKKGELSDPVPSKLGYHIIKVTDERAARGEIEVSHILIRKKDKGKKIDNAKEMVDSVYQQLLAGADFKELVKRYSQDVSSVNKGGYIGFFGINRFEKSFENAAFNLKNNGEFTKPVETAVGWHIIKRLSRKDLNDYESLKRAIQKDVQRDSRLEIAKLVMIEKIKENANYKEDQLVLDNFIANLGENFYSYNWKVPTKDPELLISFKGDLNFTDIDFAQYCRTNSRKRMRFDKGTPVAEAINSLFNEFVNEKCTIYEETNLEKKYPEFRALMREYEEGILLFEATKMKVWDKASQDTLGLNEYFKNHREDFRWDEKALVKRYDVTTENTKKVKKVRKCVKKESDEELLSRFNKNEQLVSIEELEIDKSKSRPVNLSWEVDKISEAIYDAEKKVSSFYKVTEIVPSKLKTMDEAKGYIIADYQDYLEQQWVKELRETYVIKMNEKVFKSLVKK